MPTVISHAVAGLGIGACFCSPHTPKSLIAVSALCAAIPDLDVVGFTFGISYGDFWGHRGFTHSLVFAAMFSAVIAALAFRHYLPGLSPLMLFLCLFLATASHGLLDAITDGGLGISLLSPFNNTRYFFPYTPIRVSPIGVSQFLTHRGLPVFLSELVWGWIPSTILLISAWLVHARRSSME